jgi:hypothetical protein
MKKKKPQVSTDLSYLKGLHPVKVIKVRGDLGEAVTADGMTVHRTKSLWMGEMWGIVLAAPYDNHFIFDDPNFKKIKGRWTPMCSCGSPAGVVGSNVYKDDASPTTIADSSHPGMMIVCLHHAQFGKHGDGSS